MRHTRGRNLFGPLPKSPFWRVMNWLCGVGAAGTLAVWYPYYSFGSNAEVERGSVWFYVGIVSSVIFVATAIPLGIRAIGMNAGKQTFRGQTGVTLKRVFLFMILPCLLGTAALVVWMAVNGRFGG